MFYAFLIQNHIDVACVCETFLKSGDVLNKHPLYDTHRNDRPDHLHKGGVMIMVRNDIKYNLLPYLRTQLVENIGVEIFNRRGSEAYKYFLVIFRVVHDNNKSNSFSATIFRLSRFLQKLISP